jgi:hypothetical protein
MNAIAARAVDILSNFIVQIFSRERLYPAVGAD